MWVCYVAEDGADGLTTYPYPYTIPLYSDTATLFWTFDPKVGGTAVLRNVVKYLPVDTANAKKKKKE